MAKSKKKSASRNRLDLFNKLKHAKIIVLVVFMLGFGGLGTYTLLKSRAAVATANGRIAYSCNASQSGGRDLCTVNPDGSASRIIASGSPDKWYLDSSWSPDGTKIAVTKAEGIGSTSQTSSVYVINADGSNERKLTNPPAGAGDNYPVWSSDGSSISFNRTGTIVTVNASTGVVIRSVRPVQGAWESFSYSPDGLKLVITSYETSYIQSIYVVNADGTTAVKINNNTGSSNKYPAWSPDGTKIAFVANTGDMDDIFLVNPDGTNQVRLNLGTTMVNGGKPKWSPDSKSIIYIAAQNQGLNIYDLGGSFRLAIKGLNADSPSWGTASLQDGMAPVANISSPSNGSTLRLKGKTQIYTVKYSATDNIGIVKLELYIDGVLKHTVLNTNSGEYGWNLKPVSRGTHTLEVRAYDSAGNTGNKIISVNK